MSLAGMEFDSVRGVCNFLSSVLPQQKFEATDGLVLQLGITLTFICQAKENTSSRHEGGLTQRSEEKRSGGVWGAQFLALLFYVFSSSPEPALYKLG